MSSDFARVSCGRWIDGSYPHAPGTLVRGDDGLLLFAWSASVDGSPLLCTLEAALDPVRGTLAGAQADPDATIWLELDGQRIDVAWPAGFTAGSEPLTLVDESGSVVARRGDAVELGQVPLGAHAGTPADPYLAAGLVFDGCYPAPKVPPEG